MSRLAATFARIREQGSTDQTDFRPSDVRRAEARRLREHALVTYVTAGDPDLARSRAVVLAIAEAGADVIEIGVPFSDPIADGPVIQRASERALASGVSLGDVLDLVADVRKTINTPIVLFTYVNPVVRMGTGVFVARAAAAGVDGVLLLDLPIEEAADMHAALDASGLDMIFLISPTTSVERLRHAATMGRGFLYAISRLGVTGVQPSVAGTARPVVEAIRAVTDLPVALGFGLSTPEHVRETCAYADAAVVGSALVQVIADAPPGTEADAAGAFVRWLKG